MSYTGSMQNTSTTYSLYNSSATPGNTVSSDCNTTSLQREDTIIHIPLKSFAPRILLHKPENLTGSLIYTILFLIIFAVIRLRGKNLFSLLLNVVVKKKKYEIILNEGITQNLIYYFLSLFLSFSILAVALTYLTKQEFNIHQIFSILLYLTGWHLFFLCILRLCSWTFNTRSIGEEAVVNLWSFHIIEGLLLSPFVLATFFVKTFAIQLLIKIIVICLILFYLVKFIRWIEILLAYRVPIFYMILYLCALEVIPLLVLYKMLV